MKLDIPTREEIENIVKRTVEKTIEDKLPEVIRKATRQEWLTTDDVMEMLDCSRRHVQYLRDSEQLAYTQNGRTIRYHINDVEQFLKNGKVRSKE